ncbi:nitronate monooxygenase [Pararhizobium capsulatum DSM 1112]|uniref:Nitronate monooxygenase n=1 Tax=Pararhizobium capsulatum DSM 1112 TaxID=1121113 RepID=A0ABU0C0H7_9HYPH|nr:nitronate monooxygenase [Pararhizobium capsulatum]MDQ0323180.1 nitronate monooxygenase [Pararhizobium capsulatum DSM 1112]
MGNPSQPLHTRLTELLRCDYPIIQAGMGGPGRSELCAAVSAAGAFGCLGMVKEKPEMIRTEIAAVRARTERPFGVNLVPSVTDPILLDEELEACFAAKVKVMVFFWDVRPDIIDRARRAGCTVIYQIGNLADAIAAERAGVDAIICQGFEAGGHIRGKVTSMVLVPQVAAAVSVPVIGSGGFGSGASLVAALALGAEGIHCGTAFLATNESYAHEYHKQRIVDASSEDTVYSDVFAIGWPPQSPVRTIENSVTRLYSDNLSGHGPDDFELDVIAQDGDEAVCRFSTYSPLQNMTGDLEALALYSGQLCGAINRVRPAGDVVREMVNDANHVLARLHLLK